MLIYIFIFSEIVVVVCSWLLWRCFFARVRVVEEAFSRFVFVILICCIYCFVDVCFWMCYFCYVCVLLIC